MDRVNVAFGAAERRIFGDPPSAVRVITTFDLANFLRAVAFNFTVKLTFVPTFFTDAVTPAFVTESFFATVVALLTAAIAGSFQLVIWPAKIFATSSPVRRT